MRHFMEDNNTSDVSLIEENNTSNVSSIPFVNMR